MKKHISSLISSLTFGCLGVCLGFTFCYVHLVLPVRVAALSAPKPPIFSNMQPRQIDGENYFVVPGTRFIFKQVFFPEPTKPFESRRSRRL
jgi:hypothetical protein